MGLAVPGGPGPPACDPERPPLHPDGDRPPLKVGGGPPPPGLRLGPGHPAHRGPGQALWLPGGGVHPAPRDLVEQVSNQPANVM